MLFSLDDKPRFKCVDMFHEEDNILVEYIALKSLINVQYKSMQNLTTEFKAKLDSDEYLQSSETIQNKLSYFREFFEMEENILKQIQRQKINSLVLNLFAYYEVKVKYLFDNYIKKFCLINDTNLQKKYDRIMGIKKISKSGKIFKIMEEILLYRFR